MGLRQDITAELTAGMRAAFIDSAVSSNLAYRPQFVPNNYKEGRKVLTSIERELSSCQEFNAKKREMFET